MPSRGRSLTGIVRASHPAPTVAVTLLVAAFALVLGASAKGAGELAFVVLLGQLSVGWSNDAGDAQADARAGRSEKPIVAQRVAASVVWRLAWAALALCVVLSILLLGWRAGSAHIAAVAAAWAYNLWLKDTVLSPLPYAVAFGLVPVVVLGVADACVVAPASAVAVAALLGVGAHLANTARDIDSDTAVGRGGLARRLGSTASRALAVGCVALAALALVVGVSVAVPALVLVLGAQVLVLGLAAWVGEGRWLFPTLLGLAALDAGVLGLWVR